MPSDLCLCLCFIPFNKVSIKFYPSPRWHQRVTTLLKDQGCDPKKSVRLTSAAVVQDSMSSGLTFGGRIALESVSPFVDHICKYFLQFFFSVREHE